MDRRLQDRRARAPAASATRCANSGSPSCWHGPGAPQGSHRARPSPGQNVIPSSEGWDGDGGSVKVVIFCGGLGMRLREYSENIPKPMIPVGSSPILWHVMRYYAHYGHKDFVLCLGYKADTIKRYFLDYDETLSNDFVLSGGGRKV